MTTFDNSNIDQNILGLGPREKEVQKIGIKAKRMDGERFM